MKKGVGLNPNNHNHFSDHLIPICVLMDMPYLVTDENYCREIQNLYPDVQPLLVEWQDVTPQYLVENFDVLYQSEYWHRLNFYSSFAALEKKYQKVMRNVHCPHGFSDKIFWFRHAVTEDILLTYGDNMFDMFKELGIEHQLNAYVRTGNYRYQYYLNNQSFFDKIVEDRIWGRFSKKQPTILYAPTCNDEEQNTTFLEADYIYENLPSNYNLIVKIHPALEETDAPAIYRTIGKYEKKGNIIFIKDFPLIYPILARTDIYLGDKSSIGYDFLAFNRPMFFLNQYKQQISNNRNIFLYRCGVEVMPEDYVNLYKIIDKNLSIDANKFTQIRSEMYKYTFGEPVPSKELKKAIIQSYDSSRKFEV
ncbi:MAG: CDP-glycerol glycerophosphotransferase family protein [Parachlamydiaceae bacterium]|nr:CDP-glycerol glycerophosphotransferase family protein [Parachlamydiaceae bacterium]